MNYSKKICLVILGSLALHVLMVLNIPKNPTFVYEAKEQNIEKKVLFSLFDQDSRELPPPIDPIDPIDQSRKVPIREKIQTNSKHRSSHSKREVVDAKIENPMANYPDLLPSIAAGQIMDPEKTETGEKSEATFSFGAPGKLLKLDQQRNVSFFVHSVDVPLSVRRDYLDEMTSKLHLALRGDYVHLIYLLGNPTLRAEIYRQFETGEAAKNFYDIMRSLDKTELFCTVRLQSLASQSESKTEYRKSLDDNRLHILITKFYRSRDGTAVGLGLSGGIAIGMATSISDKIVRRQEEIDAFKGRELTKSIAYRQPIRNKKFLVQR